MEEVKQQTPQAYHSESTQSIVEELDKKPSKSFQVIVAILLTLLIGYVLYQIWFVGIGSSSSLLNRFMALLFTEILIIQITAISHYFLLRQTAKHLKYYYSAKYEDLGLSVGRDLIFYLLFGWVMLPVLNVKFMKFIFSDDSLFQSDQYLSNKKRPLKILYILYLIGMASLILSVLLVLAFMR